MSQVYDLKPIVSITQGKKSPPLSQTEILLPSVWYKPGSSQGTLYPSPLLEKQVYDQMEVRLVSVSSIIATKFISPHQ